MIFVSTYKVLVLLVKLIFVWVGFDEMPLQEAFWLVFFLYKLYIKCFSTVRIHQQYAHFSIFCIFCNFLMKSIKFWRISLAEPTILFLHKFEKTRFTFDYSFRKAEENTKNHQKSTKNTKKSVVEQWRIELITFLHFL